MAEYTKYVKEAQDQALSAAEQFAHSQDQVLTAVREAVGAVRDEMPTPAEIIETGFAFTARWLEIQKQYALRLWDVFTPTAPAKQ
jgi:hypothetical protein